MDDHVHLAVGLARIVSVSELVEKLKIPSSQWFKKTFNQATFSWQRGYGAFSLGESDLASLLEYIDKQEEHHRKLTFQEEYLQLLELNGVPYDPKYMWD